MSKTHGTTEFRLSTPSLDFWVDVRLRSFGERWIAAAEIGSEMEIGLGSSARQALAASLASLGESARAALLADPSAEPRRPRVGARASTGRLSRVDRAVGPWCIGPNGPSSEVDMTRML